MRTLILSAFLIFNLAAASQAAGFSVDDPAGNLIGDSRRGYVDITQIRVQQSDTQTVIKISVSEPFPDPSTLLGMGMEFIFTFRSSDADESAVVLESRVELYDKGWIATHKRSDENPAGDSLPIDFSVTPTGFTINFPNSFIGNAETVEIVSDTANKPKWKPVTSNPPVAILLSHSQDQSQTASH
jgi:hypothetical protein